MVKGIKLSEDEVQALEVYRRARELGNSEIVIAFHEGERNRLWLTHKMK